MFNKNQNRLFIMWIIVILSIVGCSINPINGNCISISNNKIEQTNKILSENTENVLISGAVSGGVSGMFLGYLSWGFINLLPAIVGGTAGGVVGGELLPLFVISSGLIGSVGGIIIGGVIGGIGGYSYDYFFNADSRAYMYEVVCSNGVDKFYTETNGFILIDKNITTSKFSIMQKDKKPIKNGSKVNLYLKDGQYQIKNQT